VEEVEITSVSDAAHVILASVAHPHASGVKLTGANGNVGIVATNNVCMQPGVTKTSYASVQGSDQVRRPATAYFSGTNNDCYGISANCPIQLTNSLSVEPAFAAPALHNFRLQPSTRLKGAGTSGLNALTDQDGNPRSQKPTIGAFEVEAQQ
jgi:hypothetical protein